MQVGGLNIGIIVSEFQPKTSKPWDQVIEDLVYRL